MLGYQRLSFLLMRKRLCCSTITTSSVRNGIKPVQEIREKANDSDNHGLTASELEEMYEKKWYNSELWFKVIKRQTQKVIEQRRPVPWRSQEGQPEEAAPISVIAQSVLKGSGQWYGDANICTEGSDLSDKVYDSREEGEEQINYPFSQDINRLKEIEALTSKFMKSDSTILRSFVEKVPSLTNSDLCSEKQTDNEEKIESPFSSDTVEHVQMSATKKEPTEQEVEWQAVYGTPDPNYPFTNAPCSGCGAILHCQNTSLPGYVPSELLKTLTRLELQNTICQRCLFLKDYNVALKVSVGPEDYTRLISRIKERTALVILVVDLLDLPSSIWSGIIDLIGVNQPIFVVGNKVDLLPRDASDYLERIRTSLRKTLKELEVDRGKNVKHVSLVSAKTGYGIEELITSIHNEWGKQGDIYLIGCTNAGKSSLFNVLLHSDLCKVQARDLIQKATISPWPGTTLNLLRFPILTPTPWRIHLRTLRLKSERFARLQERKLRQMQFNQTRDPKFAMLIGNIGMTFKDEEYMKLLNSKDQFKMTGNRQSDLPLYKRKIFDSNDYEYVSGRWFYDTPGSVSSEQILSLLTLEELAFTLSTEMIIPRCVVLKPGWTLFLAALARIDYIEGMESVSLMLYSSEKLPISIVPTKSSEEYYENYVGTSVLKVPFGDERRLKDFPQLKSKSFEVTGTSEKECCADFILSSAGWVSLALKPRSMGRFLVSTPGGKGCSIRQPALLKHAILLRGKRILQSPFCYPSKIAK